MSRKTRLIRNEVAIHLVLIFLGIIGLFMAGFLTPPTSAFWRPLLINLGSSLIVVTILFAVFEALREEIEATEASKSQDNYEQRKTAEMKIFLLETQAQPSPQSVVNMQSIPENTSSHGSQGGAGHG